MANAQTAATAWVEGVVKAEGIDCGFHRVPGFLFEAGQERLNNRAYQASSQDSSATKSTARKKASAVVFFTASYEDGILSPATDFES